MMTYAKTGFATIKDECFGFDMQEIIRAAKHKNFV